MTRELSIVTQPTSFLTTDEVQMNIESVRSPFETKHLNPHITASLSEDGVYDYLVPTYYNAYTFQPTELPELKALLAKDECKFLLRSIGPDANVVEECRWLMNYGMENPKEFINNEYIRIWNGENPSSFEDYTTLVDDWGYTFPIPYSVAHHSIRNAHLFYGGSYHNLPSKSYQPKMTAKQQLFKDLGFTVPPKNRNTKQYTK